MGNDEEVRKERKGRGNDEGEGGSGGREREQ